MSSIKVKKEQVEFLDNLFPKTLEDVTIPNNSKLFFCKNIRYSRDFVRNSGVISCSIKRDSEKADFCIYDEEIVHYFCYNSKSYIRQSEENTDRTFNVNYMPNYVIEHIETMFQIKDKTKLIGKLQLHRALNKNMKLDTPTTDSIINMLKTNIEIGTTLLSKYCPIEEYNYCNYIEILTKGRFNYSSACYKQIVDSYIKIMYLFTKEIKKFSGSHMIDYYQFDGLSENISINKTFKYNSISNWLTDKIRNSFIEHVKSYPYLNMVKNANLTFDTDTSPTDIKDNSK
jgi:hypothetical protein